MYKRKSVKRQIQCPLCPYTAQWIAQHLRRSHKLSKEDAIAVSMQDDTYRRRGAANPKPRMPCIFPGCRIAVTHMGNHMRRKHKTTSFAVCKNFPPVLVTTSGSDGLSAATAPLVSGGPSASTAAPPASIVPLPSVAALAPGGPSASSAAPSASIVPLASAAPLASDGPSASTAAPPASIVPSATTVPQELPPLCQSDEDDDMIPPSPHGSRHDLEQQSDGDMFDSDLASESEEVVSPQNPASAEDKEVATLMTEFKLYIEGMDSGIKARPEMYVLGARQIMKAVGNDILFMTKQNVQTMYVTPLIKQGQEQTIQVKTVRNKLLHLEHFTNFVLFYLNKPSVKHDKSIDEVISNMNALQKALPSWRKALRKRCNLEDIHRSIKNGNERLQPDDIHRYLRSEYAMHAIKLLNLNLAYWTPSMYDFTKVRNHMMAILSIGNAQRSGVLINFSLNTYEHATVSGNSLVFAVAEQKSGDTHGAATFAVNQEEATLLKSYMRLRKLERFDQAEPFVFINITGTQMTTSNVATALTTAFKNSGYKYSVSCSKVRKAVVTEVHDKFPDRKQDVADHMLHRLSTATIHYKYTDKQKNSVACSNLIRQAMSSTSQIGEDSQFQTSPSTSVQLLASASVQLPASASASSTANNYSDTEDDTILADPYYQPYTKKVSWSAENRDLVRHKFDDFVQRQKTPIAEISAVLKRDKYLRKQLESSLKLSADKLA